MKTGSKALTNNLLHKNLFMKIRLRKINRLIMNMKKCSRIFEEMIDRRERNIFLIHSITLYIENVRE